MLEIERQQTSQLLALLACFVLALLSIAFALLFGSVESTDIGLILDLRLPRVLSAFSIGALLATAGNLLQTYTRNPLAEPSVLGVSGGASVGALLAMIFGVSIWLGAWLGSVLLFGLLWYLTSAGKSSPSRLLLAGVMLATACGAIISITLLMVPDRVLPGVLHWMMGDLQGAMDWRISAIVLMSSLFLLFLVWLKSGSIQLLPLGWDKAASLGVEVIRMRILILFASSLAIAISVSIAGNIGFIGLVVPHAVRLLFPKTLAIHQRWIIPACGLLGGTFLVIADLLSRTLLSPSEMPVGVVTAAIGVPTFLYLLSRSERERGVM